MNAGSMATEPTTVAMTSNCLSDEQGIVFAGQWVEIHTRGRIPVDCYDASMSLHWWWC